MISPGKVIQFTDKLYDVDDYATIPFDPGFVARVESVKQKDDLLVIGLQFAEFEERNYEILRNTWPNDVGDPVLKWVDTEYYPIEGKATIIVYKSEKPFKILKNI